MLKGETISNGAPKICDKCQTVLNLAVLSSPAGYYIGTRCQCGPYSRESIYYLNKQAVELAFKQNCWIPR